VNSIGDLLEDDEVRSISRRYFISNGFDGTLTSIGVVVGAYLSGISDGLTVITIGLGAAVGLGTSGVWSVWGDRTGRETGRTAGHRASDVDRPRGDGGPAAAGGRSQNQCGRERNRPLIGILLPLSPFLAEGIVLSMLEATLVAIAVGVGVLFVFGAYLGSISKQNWIVAGIRMGLAGIVVAFLNLFLPG